MKFKNFLSALFLICFFTITAQTNFEIEDNKKHFSLNFQLINDLVIIPVELNGVQFSFLLDTGVDSTIFFSLEEIDSLKFKNANKLLFGGMGAIQKIEGFKSEENTLRIGKAINRNFSFFVVHEGHLDLSYRMGIPIHGIIGYDFFKDFIIKFNYLKEKIKVYDPEDYKYSNCHRCDDFELKFHQNKPYLEANLKIKEGEKSEIHLLIDSGLGDALWLFPNSEKNIYIPDSYFKDFLGHGFGGSLYGKRSRIQEIDLGDHKLEMVTTSFPDSLYIKDFINFNQRNGSIGSQILKRFHSIFDYTNKRLRLKPNRNYNKPFEYDMSGITVAHSGYSLIKTEKPIKKENNGSQGILAYTATSETKYSLQKEYKVVEIRPGSPAEQAGLQIGDIVESINGRQTYRLQLSKINAILSSGSGKRIKLKIKRNNIEKVIVFNLERML